MFCAAQYKTAEVVAGLASGMLKQVRTRGTRKLLLGRMPLPLLVVGSLFLAALVAATVQTALYGNLWPHILGNTIGYGLIGGFEIVLLTMRVEGDNAGLLLVYEPVTVRTIPAAVIAEFRHDRGLRVVTVDGHTYGSMAFGSSLFGTVTGYRRAGQAARRCRAWLHAAQRAGYGTSGTIRIQIRWRVLWGVVLFVAGLLLLATVVYRCR